MKEYKTFIPALLFRSIFPCVATSLKLSHDVSCAKCFMHFFFHGSYKFLPPHPSKQN